ncbi:MAG: hypothetical protein ACD_9C00085G0001 [uncultured bacterium]|nr:MAG: hypothetical protein ACD_9C00085G0001 [uncultured bacterium]
MNIFELKNRDVSWKLLIPYRVVAIFFVAVALITLLASLVNPIGLKTLVSVSYIVMDVILIYGFWNMRKWIITLMSLTFVFLVINNAMRILQGTQKIGPAVGALAFVAVIALLAYFSRHKLNGLYGNVRVLRVFVVALVLSQILIIF